LAQRLSWPGKQAELFALIAEHAEPETAREMMATCLRQDRWSIPLRALAAADPDAIPPLVAEFDTIYSKQLRADQAHRH
jgi:hypothetical protein